jgi:hypothetical protein
LTAGQPVLLTGGLQQGQEKQMARVVVYQYSRVMLEEHYRYLGDAQRARNAYRGIYRSEDGYRVEAFG